MGRKGQITLEYLFLAALSLALIGISLAALLKIKEAGDRAYRLELFKSSAMDVYNLGEELCAMGSGNSMELRVREDLEISGSAGQTAFSSRKYNISFSKGTLCDYEAADIPADSTIELINDDGLIASKIQ